MENKVSVYDTMIFAEVGRNAGDILMDAAKGAGAHGGTIVPCRYSSDNTILQILGIGESDRDIVLILSDRQGAVSVMDAIKEAAHDDKRLSGFAGFVRISAVMKYLTENGRMEILKTGEQRMDRQTSYEMIAVIVNSGYADDVMAAARKAGAHGGTVLNARGTGKQEDVKFFGITIVPEKEILLIVAEKKDVDPIMSAIKALDCFSNPGSGICFCADVDNFTLLGKK